MFLVSSPVLYVFCRTRKKEICDVFYANLIFYHLPVKFMILQEQHANSLRALMSDSRKLVQS